MAVKSESLQRKVSLDTPLSTLFVLNWEIALYVALFVIAVITRFYDLGARVMSHDESLHTLYSWNLYAGKGYQHDPLMHGPFLFHINALIYFLFGDNDFTARVSTALFGVTLVILPYWFRPWLGRLGALSASIIILISPGLLYYSRYIRHDIFISVWTTLMILALFQYMRTRASRWLFIGAAAVAFMLSTKEVAFIHGFIGFTFILLAWMWENLSKSWRQLVTYGLVGLIVLLALAVTYMAIRADVLTVTPAEGEEGGFNPWSYIDVMIMITELLIGTLIVQLGVDRTNRPVTAALKSLNERLPDIIKAVILAAIIFTLLYTTFFSNIAGLGTGTVGAVSYWLSQQEVQRGGQPWYYYLFLVPLYEFLPMLVGVIGGLAYIDRKVPKLWVVLAAVIFPELVYSVPNEIAQPWRVILAVSISALAIAILTLRYFGLFQRNSQPFPAHTDAGPSKDFPPDGKRQTDLLPQSVWPSDGGTFAAFAIYWTLVAFAVYSWAGEKMPWLTVHMTLPLIFLAAHVIQTALKKLNWSEIQQKGGLILGGASLLVIPALATLVTAQPFRSQSLQSINETLQFIAALIVLLALAAVIWYYGRQIGRAQAQRTVFAAVLLVLTLLTIRFAWLLSYVNYDYVNEMLVYAHASPDVKIALNQIDDISRRTVGDKMIKVAYDNDSTWPLEWYMREYPNRAYYGENPTREALDAPVVIVGAANESKVKPFLGDKYIRFRYRLVWWPIEDYKGQTPNKLWQNYVAGSPPENPLTDTAADQTTRREIVRQNWQKLFKIIFYRDYEDYELNEWPFVHRFYVYVRKDVLNDIWDYQSGPIQLAQTTSLDPYEGKRTETDALTVWGSNGSGDGQFVTPRNLAVGSDGSIYVADSGNHRIQVFDKDGNFLLKWGSEGAQPGQFSEPWGIAVAEDGTVFVADTWNHRIQAFTSTGQFLRAFGSFVNVQNDPQAETGKFWGPRDIAIDAQGNLYVTDTGNKRIQKFTSTGEFLQMWGGGGIIPGSFEEPVGIDIDSQGNIYVADTWNRRIQKFDINFNPIAQWDVVGWESESVVNKPYLAVDPENRVIISDPEGYRLIAYTNTGEVLVTWGQYGQDLASMALPTGFDFDREGHLLVADSDNNRIMKFLVPTIEPSGQ